MRTENRGRGRERQRGVPPIQPALATENSGVFQSNEGVSWADTVG